MTILQGDALTILSGMNSDTVDLCYIDPPFKTGRDFGAYQDSWDNTSEYIKWLRPFICESKRVLKPTGNFILHLDHHAVHYAKVMCDEIFGEEHFSNEIIWCYNSGGASKRHLARKHDTLLSYTLSDDFTFNVIREPYATPNVKGRAGFNDEGRMLNDTWNIPFISTTANERVGYPTQKPLLLLERVINVFSNPGDLVIDPFCGSGTTGHAASKLGRSYIVSDINEQAIELTTQRLK